MSRSILSALTLSAVLLSAPACYNYVPTEPEAVPPGADVRLRMSREGGEALARILESNEIRVEVSGQYEGLDQGSVLLRVPVVRDPSGIQRNIQQLVRLPERDVVTVDRRELSVGKTAGLVAVGASGVALLLYGIFDVFDDGRNDGPDAELSLVPLFGFLFGGR